MSNTIFGINLNEPLTPLIIRDAIVNCFWDAHCADTGIDESEKEINKKYCHDTVVNAFNTTGGNFDNPTKESIINACKNLATFSENFRDKELVRENFNKIMQLVEKLDN